MTPVHADDLLHRGRAMADRVREAGEAALVAGAAAVWSHIQPAQPAVVGWSIAPTDNLQRPMNLIMPLLTGSLFNRANALDVIVGATSSILSGLDSVGTIHFARFDLIGSNLCMFSIYDGDLAGYIRDFIGVIGEAFDAIMGVVADPPPTPVAEHADEFVAWIAARDAFRFPEEPTDLLPRLDAVQRESVLVLRRERNVQLGLYRSYPGFSSAQIRQRLGEGW